MDLALQLKTEAAILPGVRQIVVAHSHGGNVAMRALHYLQEDATNQATNAVEVVTIATPFLKADIARFRKDQLFALRASGCLINLGVFALAIWMATGFFDGPDTFAGKIAGAVIGTGVTICSGALIWFLTGIGSDGSKEAGTPPASDRARSLAALVRYPAQGLDGRLLVVRGMQDEAAMMLMLGSIGVRLTDFATSVSSKLGLVLFTVGILIPGGLVGAVLLRCGAILLLSTILGIMIGNLAKTVYGRELLFGSSPVVVSGDSVPDLQGTATIVTLARRGQRGTGLLHSLYNHPQCASLVARWIAGKPARPGSIDDASEASAV